MAMAGVARKLMLRYVTPTVLTEKPEDQSLLSNSTCVEDKVSEFARKCNHEHACHALIVDVNDPSWISGRYFTQEESEEIASYNLEPMPTLPTEVTQHLQSFQAYDPEENPTGKTVEQIMNYKVDNSALDLVDDYDLIWVNDSVARATKMYRWGYFPITSHTEGDLLRRVWVLSKIASIMHIFKFVGEKKRVWHRPIDVTIYVLFQERSR
ncbi:hypothetical protein BJV82DRAFT_716173 [Fennellomyces sp. T-0311]|nr:hypothetical protein BJV82DRAFT_716173 [Fennellomyces sp. T-0311]